MKTMRMIGALAVLAVAGVACEDITNPVDSGELTPPWVRFDVVEEVGDLTTYVPIIFEAPSRPEEDITIDFTFGGDAVFGEDFVVVADSGSTTPREGITAEGGTLTLEYDPNREQPHDTLWVYVPQEATAGRVLTAEMVSAQRADGSEVTLGYLGNFATFEMTVRAPPVDIPEGDYDVLLVIGGVTYYGAPSEVTNEETTVDDVVYQQLISDINGYWSSGGVPIVVPWAFTVFADGSVEFAPESHESPLGLAWEAEFENAQFDFESNTLTADVTWSSPGAASYSIIIVPQED